MPNRRAPHDVEIRLELIRRREVAVVNRELEVPGHPAGAALEPDLAVVVLRDAPLRAVRSGRLLQEAVRRPAQPERVDGAVHPVVHRPEQAGLLRLHVARAAEARREQLLLVGHAVAVRVGVFPHFVRVRLHRQDRCSRRTAARSAGTPACRRRPCDVRKTPSLSRSSCNEMRPIGGIRSMPSASASSRAARRTNMRPLPSNAICAGSSMRGSESTGSIR